MTVLLDSNVLVALAVVDHVHHEATDRWFADLEEPFASCPITEGALLRLVIREGATAAQAQRVLAGITALERHEFWPDALDFAAVSLRGVVGHRQVTDAYLAALARSHRGTLATYDAGLTALHPDVGVLLTPS